MKPQARPAALYALWAVLTGLVLATLWLACNRIYQVDEAQTVYMASVLAKGWKANLYTSGQLHLFPLALLVRPGMTSSQIFLAFRLAFFGLFWLNAVLVVVAAGIRLRSRTGLAALVLTGTLAPWWAYALECRHDNILILGVLLMWILGRRTPTWPREIAFFALGALALLLQACLFKSIATWAPLSMVLLLLEAGPWLRRVRYGLCWALGAAAIALMTREIRAWSGLLANVNEGASALSGALGVERFAPWHALGMLFRSSPLLTAAMAGLLVYGVLVLHREGLRNALATPGMAGCLLFAVGVVAFLVNPTPFPYNLGVLSALAMVALLQLAAPWLAQGALSGKAFFPYLVTATCVLHFLPLASRFLALTDLPNDRQEDLMAMAEGLTGPGDPVFDAIGMVPTRPAPSFTWVLNMMNAQAFAKIPMTHTWEGNVPPVILPSYRLNYLQPRDLEFIRGNYVAIRKDFYLLGVALGKGGLETWDCRRPGRYSIVPLSATFKALHVDGVPMAQGFYTFAAGRHTLATQPFAPCLVVWAGPTQQVPPFPKPDQGMESLCPVPMGL